MSNRDQPPMSAQTTERFIVVRNQSGRWSCWPEGRTIPNRWTPTSIAGTKQQCLDAIDQHARRVADTGADSQRMKMSLMFFGDSETDSFGDKYRLLMESARFADRHGLEGLWLPERHFTRLGCLYPAPAVVHAAIARETRSIRLRAGSIVMPLNDPLRVAEQWAVVDNLSSGRVELAFASGWHPDDFSLMPDAYADRNSRMFQDLQTVQALWRGESIERTNGIGQTIHVRTYPTPIQGDLPVWLTAAGSAETFRRAGEQGYGVLTHLFHQDIHQLEEKIKLYRAARRAAGHDEREGRVAVTLHTYVADSLDAVRSNAGDAYRRYLRSNLGLLKQLAFSHGQAMDIESLPKAELDQVLRWMLDKFIGGRSLMGTIETCSETCRELAGIGVSEVACLLDFGPDADDVLSKGLPLLAKLHSDVGQLVVR